MFGRGRLPDWSPFEDVDAHREFLRLLRRELARTGLRHDSEQAGRVVAFRGLDARLDVAELASAAAVADVGDWVAVIAGRVATVLDPPGLPDDPDVLRDLVRVRLVAPEQLADLGGIDLVARRHAGLVEVVVVETPRAVQWGEVAELSPLGLRDDELLELGRANVRVHERPTVRAVDLGGASVLTAESHRPFVASWALLLDDLVTVPPAGAVLAVPDLRSLSVVLLDGPGARIAIDALVAPTVDRFSTVGGAVSPHLHLWQDGTLSIQPVTRRDDGSLGVVPGPQLVAALARLEG